MFTTVLSDDTRKKTKELIQDAEIIFHELLQQEQLNNSDENLSKVFDFHLERFQKLKSCYNVLQYDKIIANYFNLDIIPYDFIIQQFLFFEGK